jgi:RNA polymerase sigma factor (sigma-70 family)
MKSLRRAILNAKKLSYRKRTNLMEEINDFDLTGIKMMDYEFEEMKNAQIKKFLKKLPIRQQEAIYMRFIAELEFQEIALKMNLTIKSVYKVIYKGLNNLRQMYDTAVA